MPTASNEYVELQNCLDLVPSNSPVGTTIEFKTKVTGRKLFESAARKQIYLCDTCSEVYKVLMGK